MVVAGVMPILMALVVVLEAAAAVELVFLLVDLLLPAKVMLAVKEANQVITTEAVVVAQVRRALPTTQVVRVARG